MDFGEGLEGHAGDEMPVLAGLESQGAGRMTFKWILIGLLLLEIVVQILTIGQPREPRPPIVVAINAVCNLGLIAGLLVFWK